MPEEIEKQIDIKIGEVRTEPLDLSYGEIVNLHSNKELVIQPEYQRLWTMLYAHYEGFYKFCWDLFLDQMERDGCSRADAVDPVAVFSLTKVFREMRGDTSSSGIWSFVNATFPKEMERPLCFPIRLETRSNLWPSVATENNEAVGLHCKEVSTYDAQLRALVGRRNDIAHGKKLVVNTLDEYETYEKAVMIVLHELAVSVVDNLTRRAFTKVGAKSTQLTLPV